MDPRMMQGASALMVRDEVTPRGVPGAGPPRPQAIVPSGRMPQRTAGPPMDGQGQPVPQGNEDPDWMTPDLKQFATKAAAAARAYNGRVAARRQQRGISREYTKHINERDRMMGSTQDLANLLTQNPALFYEMDDKGRPAKNEHGHMVPNAQGMALIRQLAGHRTKLERLSSKEKEFMQKLSAHGVQLPNKPSLTMDDIGAIDTAHDQDFDDFVSQGYAAALADTP